MEYFDLDQQTTSNRYPFLSMAETLDELNRATFFMSVDVVTRYHQKMDKAYLVYPMPVFNI